MSRIEVAASLTDDRFDSLVLLFNDVGALESLCPDLKAKVQGYANVNEKALSEVSVLEFDKLPSKRLVLTPTGPLNRDYDDVRRISEAAGAGVAKAVKAGSKKPLLAVAPLASKPDESWAGASCVSLNAVLGSLHALYSPLEVREASMSDSVPLGVFLPVLSGEESAQHLVEVASALEEGRRVARDIGGSDPERMAAPRIAEHVQEVFGTGSAVKVEMEMVDVEKYPLMAAVDRAAAGVPRHAGRVLHFDYAGEGEAHTTLMVVGKGITYDTGGADIKAGGVMAGMHRDKCGAAAVVGFFRVLDILRPPAIRVLGSIACVRNSVGSNCYVADEIITSRAGVRVRVGNTDAEGRMAMADLLCRMKERALTEEGLANSHIFTWATLTGHVIRAYGDKYTGVMDNGRARRNGIAQSLQAAGDLVSDPFEVSTVRREDWETFAAVDDYARTRNSPGQSSTKRSRGHQGPAAFLMIASGLSQISTTRREDFEAHTGKSIYEEVLQCNNQPSSATPRGHQSPSAFLAMASGISKHGLDSEKPLSYTHVDVAGSSGPFPGVPTGAPILAFAARYIFPRIGLLL